jgi:hypothetical protein
VEKNKNHHDGQPTSRIKLTTKQGIRLEKQDRQEEPHFKISGSHGGDYEDGSHLGCSAV